MNRRHLLLVALVAVGLSSVTGVGSVSSVGADRDVSVAVADDREAFLGIEFGSTDWPNQTRELRVTNRASTSPLDVTVAGETVTVGPGEVEALTVPCGAVDVVAVGSEVRIDATRSVACEHSGDGDASDDRTNNGRCSNSDDHGKSGESGHCGRDSNEGDREEDARDRDGDGDDRERDVGDRERDREERDEHENDDHDEGDDRREHKRHEGGDQTDRDGDAGGDH